MSTLIAVHKLDQISSAQRTALLRRTEDDLSGFISEVRPIIDGVRRHGDRALAQFAQEFDGANVTADAIAATTKDFDAAFRAIEPAMLETLEYAAENIRRFHTDQMPAPMWWREIRRGVLVGERITPIQSVACYSPRGKGSFPSVTLMTAIPAVVAGVPKPIILTPAGADGMVDAATLVAARIAGVDQVYKAGGAQAVAAAAFGTETIPQCHKIEGPGSPWFTAARRVLADRIESRLPAGPSESIVLADDSVDPRLAALDTLIESEHGADSSAFLVTWSQPMATQAAAAIPQFWQQMSPQRAAYSMAVLGGNSGGIVLAQSPQQAYDFINDYAPEHLQILSKQPFDHLPYIHNAAEILLGEYATGAIANYLMGPNCVLPTSGAARVHSPLGVHDFLKRSSIGHLTNDGFRQMAPHTHRFATYEGFDAHANAVSATRTAILNSAQSSATSDNAKCTQESEQTPVRNSFPEP